MAEESAPAQRELSLTGLIADWWEDLSQQLTFSHLCQFGGIALQLGLTVLIIRQFNIESKAFLYLIVLTWVGFVIHHFLPAVMRLPFFGLLSILALGIIFGIENTIWVVTIGFMFIAIAHLPLKISSRIALLVSAGAGLAAARAGSFESPIPSVIWPILGVMFMFRMIIYMYDMKNNAAPFSFWRSTGYFFMLPNVCFPLFPVIDYKAFCSSYFDRNDIRIYQDGVQQIFRGCIHLLLYRLIYQNLLIDPAEITSSANAAQFIVTTYLLYLKVSGSFHIIVGMLHLFGFNLPETHHNFLLSSSFTDFWRRINIYWKDFILKCFFNPIYFPLVRKYGTTRAMIVATVIAFVATWLLHSYQWFWIRGDFPIIWQDMVFWTFLMIVVLLNMLYESSHGRRRSLNQHTHTWRTDLSLGLRTVAMFVVISCSWSLWTAETWQELKSMFLQLLDMTAREAGIYVALLVGLGLGAVMLARSSREAPKAAKLSVQKQPMGDAEYWRSTTKFVAAACIVLGIGMKPDVLSFSPVLVDKVSDLRSNSRLNSRDSKLLERGYYEDLSDVTRFSPALQELYADRPPDWKRADMVESNSPFPPFRLKPSVQVEYRGAPLETNRWGMRDKDYEKVPAERTLRIAMLGASHTMGSGVRNGQSYESLVEARLNREFSHPDYDNYEILNFSVGGFGPLCRLWTLENRVMEFQPDIVLYVAIDDFTWIKNEIAHNITEPDNDIPFVFVQEAISQATDADRNSYSAMEQIAVPLAPDLVGQAYDRFVTNTRNMGAKPVAMFLPKPERASAEFRQDVREQAKLADQAGFTLLDISTAYDQEENLPSLWVAKWDRHPGVRGHRMVAERFYEELTAYLEQHTFQ